MADKHTEVGVWLTTNDNPYDPSEQYEEWSLYDKLHGHDCMDLLGRFSNCSDQLSETENLIEIENAIDRIIATDLENKYVKLKKEYVVDDNANPYS